jgi:hypothetical protein
MASVAVVIVFEFHAAMRAAVNIGFVPSFIAVFVARVEGIKVSLCHFDPPFWTPVVF